MNRRYIDFVPTNNPKVTATARPVRPKVQVKPKPQVTARPQVATSSQIKRNLQPRSAMVARTRVLKSVSTVRRAPVTSTPAERKMPVSGGLALGVVEDLNSHFVNTNVPKRPLSEKPVRPVQPTRRVAQVGRRSNQITQTGQQPAKTAQTGAADLKAKKIKASLSPKSVSNSTKKPTPKSAPKTGLSKETPTYKTPKPAFINQNKVVKRPLSGGNVYHKQSTAKAAKEEPKGPVTIIAKPEKDKHIGIVVTIIITIILGAAAGTVAFLLLPK